MAIRAEMPATKQARRPALDRDVAMTLAATEYARVVTMVENLTPHQWAMPTECPGWDVRAMAGHMLGMAQLVATVPELVRQQVASQRGAKRSGTSPLDALTALQVAKNAHLSAGEVVQQMRMIGPRATRGRRRMPAVIRHRRIPDPQDVGDVAEWWTFGFLFDVVLTRDPFMHRIDISRATGAPLQTTAAHEGVLVDDVVREWAGRHGRPFHLELTGTAGGTWEHGESTGEREVIRMDAVDFCRSVAGRGPATGLLAAQVPF
jgi:uncharacterized protein (TIGR03083 family)